MNDKEYTYDIDKYTIGVDENGEDGIGMTVAKIENGEIIFLGNCYGENARCIDLLIKENKQLNGAIQTYDILLKSNIEENKRLKEEVKAVNKGLRKVQQRSIKYKNRCLKLNEKIKKIKQPQMFIDTQDIEERYAEELYRDFLKEENKQLKKQLEEKENIACDWKDSCLENAGKIEILETQQKEFIKYLENMLDDENDIFSVVRVKDALQKYREIIGVER